MQQHLIRSLISRELCLPVSRPTLSVNHLPVLCVMAVSEARLYVTASISIFSIIDLSLMTFYCYFIINGGKSVCLFV